MPRPPLTVVSALADALRSEPGRPLVTMYDDATGERIELSVATFDNWVSKVANLFSLDWELDSGERISLVLPAGWQAMVTLLGAWTAGLTVSLTEDAAASRTIGSWQDIAADVPAQPDVVLSPQPLQGASGALVTGPGTATHADLVARAVAAADDIGLAPGGRLLTDLSPVDPIGVDVALLAPLVTGASVVLLLNATEDRRERVAAQERTTCAAWSTG